MEIRDILLGELEAHPGNSNVMSKEMLEKLAGHIGRTGRYPPVVVRRLGEGRYQILDGHHRVAVLRELGKQEARCVVWEVDDAEALLLLATLNRMQGKDDPRKRARLVEELAGVVPGVGGLTPAAMNAGGVLGELPGVAELARLLPEDAGGLERLLKLRLPPAPRGAAELGELPVSVHFFLRAVERDALEAKLKAVGGGRGEALLKLVGVEGNF